MDQFSGVIFNGELDQNRFYLTQVKTVLTASTLTIDQLIKLTDYLKAQQGSCTIMVNDQIPILLKGTDIEDLLGELNVILSELNLKQ